MGRQFQFSPLPFDNKLVFFGLGLGRVVAEFERFPDGRQLLDLHRKKDACERAQKTMRRGRDNGRGRERERVRESHRERERVREKARKRQRERKIEREKKREGER